MAKRIEAAQAAQTSGDPAAVAEANERVIALGLRELGQLRLLESAYPQAIDLYQRSLKFEDNPDTRVDLSISELQAGQFDDAIADANQALAADPNNERAYTVLGRAWTDKRDFAKAADALTHAVALKSDLESYYALGICLLSTKNPKDKQRAADVFQEMVRRYGDSGSIHVLFGRAYRDADDMAAASLELQRAVEIDPRTPHAYYFLGLVKLSLNEWKPTAQAEADIKMEVDYYPHDFLSNYMLGFLASSERNYAVSDRYLKIAAGLNPTWPEPWLYMGLNAFDLGDMKSAEPMLRKAIALTGKDESRSNFQIRRAYIDLGRILEETDRKQEAEVYLNKARALQEEVLKQSQQGVTSLALSEGAGAGAALVPLSPQNEEKVAPALPVNADPFARLDASALAHTDLTAAQRAAADSQENRLRSVLGLSFNDLATSEAIQGDYPTALSRYQEAEHWDATIPGLEKNLGQCAYRANNYPEAIRGLSLALAAKNDDAPVRAMLGMAYFATNQYAQAAKTFSPLGVPGMHDPDVGYAWAVSLTRTSDLKKASEVLDEYEKGKLPNQALLLAGELWIEIGDYGQAVATLHRALQSDPSLPKAHYFAGEADIRREHWSEAVTEFQAELALVPTDPDAKYDLGFVYLEQSKVGEAEKLFREVIAVHPEHANAQYELGKILLDRGDVTGAIDHLEAAERLSPGKAYVHYQLQAAYRKDSRDADADRELEIYKELKAKSRASDAPHPVEDQ